PLVCRPHGIHLEQTRPAEWNPERPGLLPLRRLSVCAPVVRRLPVRQLETCRRCHAARQGTVGDSYVLAKRVQPAPRTIPAHAIRNGADRQRVSDAISIFDWGAWRAPLLE